jgi:hypothetical protein
MAENLATAYAEAQAVIDEVGAVNAPLANFLNVLMNKVKELPQTKELEIQAILEMIVNSAPTLKTAAKS